MDIEIDLDRSEYVKRRINLMKSLHIPTLSEAKHTLGPSLAQILFDQCNSALKIDFGLTPLKGTGDELWVSPSDLLIGKVALKPPLTSKHIQALTHQGILKIGGEIEKKFWNETRMHEENYFDSRKRHIMDQFDELFRVESKNIEQRERQIYMNQSQKMIEEFDCILLEELNNLEDRLKSEQEEALRKQKRVLNQEWDNKFNKEINTTVQNMTVKFVDELDKQKSILTSNFRLELQKAHIQRGYDVNLERSRCKESITHLRHNLECKNIANMMYVLCMERRKCCQEKKAIEEHYLNEIQSLRKIIFNRDQQIKMVTEEKNRQIEEVNLREACLLEIIRQFQKFINFALRAAPTQAEFLLSLEKMMAFELTNAVLNSKYSRLQPCEEVMPWKHQEKVMKAPPEDSGLVIQDYHNCLKETIPPRPEGLSPEDYLPAFNYKNKLYVREDFRNMISQGIEIRRSNELWSKDVEILIQTLRKSVSQIKAESKESVKQEPSEEALHPGPPKFHAVSSVQFMTSDDLLSDRQKRISYDENQRKGSEERRASLKPVFPSLENINFEQIGKVEKKPFLIAATNSLDLILKKGSIKQLPKVEMDEEYTDVEDVTGHVNINSLEGVLKRDKVSDGSFRMVKNKSSTESSRNKEMGGSKQSGKKEREPSLLDARDSIIMKKASLVKKSAEFAMTPKDSVEIHRESKFDIKRKLSRLVSAKNSLELLRESKIKIDGPLGSICQRKESLRQKQNSCSKSKCNDKCSQTKDIDVLEDLKDEDVKYFRDSDTEKSIKLSHIEVIRVHEPVKDPNVAINAIPIIYETGSATYSIDLTNMYAEEDKIKKPKKKKSASPKDKYLNLPSKTEVIGDTSAKEHLQSTNEFTEQRIHSLIELIKDNPQLMRTFTACTR